MSDKWADYLISKVEYNDKETHITRVLSHPDNGDTVGDGVDLVPFRWWLNVRHYLLGFR